MKKGVVILKPDFFEYGQDIKLYLDDLIAINELKLESFYEIKSYGDFCERYRLFDITNSNYTKEEAQKELQRTSYATFVYKELFNEKPAIALVFEDENADDLYDKMSELKKGVRAYIKSNRKKDYFVDTNNQWRAFEYYEDSGVSKEYIESDLVKMAYLNGIHLEERALFDRDICYTFLRNEKNITRKEKHKAYEEKDI